jgi:shikimate dehydrogenase
MKITHKRYSEEETERIFAKIKKDKENIVLVGIPASGKSTVGTILADKLSREFIDTDSMIEEAEGMSIPEIFTKYGEKYFRDRESEAVSAASAKTSTVIATGGGAILRNENVKALKQNGKIYFIDRPLKSLIPTEDRPLSNDRESIKKRYEERYGLYLSASDVRINADTDANSVSDRIAEDFLK